MKTSNLILSEDQPKGECEDVIGDQVAIIFLHGGLNDVEPVPKLVEPECCGCCNIETASITLAIINFLLAYAYSTASNPNIDSFLIYIHGALGLCYTGIAFCRTSGLCYIASAFNHLFSIPFYCNALYFFIHAIMVLSGEEKDLFLEPAHLFIISALFALFGILLTYMGKKFQEFGDYIEKENKLIHV